MKILESSENYLERILMLKDSVGRAYSVDIANALNVSKASVSVAMKKLRENGYLLFNEDNSIELTEKGLSIAVPIYERHKFLTDWLLSLGVPEEIAREDACRLEHGLSDESFNALRDKAADDLAKCEICDDITKY